MLTSAVSLQLAHHLRNARLGRRRLAELSGVSEMTVRIELERLRDAGFVRMDRTGARLTSRGLAHFSPPLKAVRAIEALTLTSLHTGEVALAAQVRNVAPATAWHLRDMAVQQGASGLLLFTRRGGTWRFSHDDEPIGERNLEDSRMIESMFPEPANEDRLLVVSAPDGEQATRALWRIIAALASH